MASKGTASALIVLASLLLTWPGGAHAEPYAGLFAGVALSNSTDVDLKLSPATFNDVELNRSVVFGGKAGFFLEAPVLGGNTGLELEVYHFRPDIDRQTVLVSANGTGTTTFDAADLHVTAIGLNGLYRFPLARDGDFPHGRLQPYAGVGLGAFIAHLETRTTVLDVNMDFGDTDVRVGVQALAGARFFLTPHLALFGEYKFVHTDDLKFNLVSDPGTRGGLTTLEVNKLQFDLTTHMLQAGIAYHW